MEHAVRIGVSSSGRVWVSMGLTGWLFGFWLVLPLLLAWYLILGVIWLAILAVRAFTAPDARRR